MSQLPPAIDAPAPAPGQSLQAQAQQVQTVATQVQSAVEPTKELGSTSLLPIPEPAFGLLGGMALLLMLRRIRRVGR